MDKNILSDVVEIERTIRERLVVEQNKSRELLASIRRDAERELSAEESVLKEAVERTLREAQIQAKTRADEIVEKTKTLAARMEKLTHDELKAVLRTYIPRIVPDR